MPVKDIEEQLRLLGKEPTDLLITISTPARMRKKDNPFSNVTKTQTLRCSVNFDYEKLMAEGQGAWVSEERKWGKHIEGTGLILHKKEYYVQVYVQEAGDPRYSTQSGRIPLDQLRAFLSCSNPSRIRDIKLSNIETIRVIDVDEPTFV